jgi:hypothetical protein
MMKKMMMSKSSGGMPVIPQGYKNGGKVKAFSGKDTKSEEMMEAKQVRSGKVSAAQYKSKEMAEEKREGEKSNPKKLMATGKALASGAMSASQYGGMAKMNDGGLMRASNSMAPNECAYNYGPGVRSQQDYKK